MVEQESYGVRENFAQQPADEVPQITRPHSLYGVALHQLAEDGIYPVTKTAQDSAPLGVRIALLGLVRGRQFDALPGQLLSNRRRPVVAVPDHHTPGMLDQLGQYRKVVDVGWSYRKTSDEPRPADPHVHPKAVEGLLEENIFAEGRLSSEAFASVGTGKQTHAGKGKESQMANVGSWGASERSSCQRRSLTFQRLAACLAKVVLCISLRAGNHAA